MVSAITPPVDVPEVFGTRGRVPVRGTINGFPFRSSLMPCGRPHMMPVNKALCQGARREARRYRRGSDGTRRARAHRRGPTALARVLKNSKPARERWEKLSFTHKKEMANSISGAKQEETKKQRLAKVVSVLETGAKWTG